MQCHLLPASIWERLDRINSNFFWGGAEDARKLHLIKRDKLMLLIENGGLGSETKLSDQSKSKTDVSTTTWSSLRKVCPLLQRSNRWSIRNGQSVNFWIDAWSGLGAIRASISGTLDYEEFDHNFKTVRDLMRSKGGIAYPSRYRMLGRRQN
ncbi:hypothetical protein GOBAR_DD30777 [Gossypium barbadense]|nr:hypothetical protein GOBAR_DD30777 [Gossypium barbadense]